MSGGFPSGKLGLWSNIVGVRFQGFSMLRDQVTPRLDMGGRWTNARQTGGDNEFVSGGELQVSQSQPILLKNRRLRDFQGTFALRRAYVQSEQIKFMFNVHDEADYDAILLWISGNNNPSFIENNNWTGENWLSSTVGPGASLPYQNNNTGLLWIQVTHLNGTVTVKALGQMAEPTSANWSAATAVYSSSSFTKTGGMAGFTGIRWTTGISHFKLWSKDGSGNFTIQEHFDPFAMDGSNYANDAFTYDNNGNLTYDGNDVYAYDAWNRLITVKNAWRSDGTGSGTLTMGSTIATYSYDAMNRRIIKAIANQGDQNCTYNEYYSGWQLIEERDGSNYVLKQYVWSGSADAYIDQLVQVNVNSDPLNASHQTCDRFYYAMQDANYNVLGLIDSSGNLVERYEYSPYGKRTVYISPGTNDSSCYAPVINSQRVVTGTGTLVTHPYGLNPFGFQGLYYDEESGNIQTPTRTISTSLGRTLQPDWDGYPETKNRYVWEINDPIDLVDPDGLRSESPQSMQARFNAQQARAMAAGGPVDLGQGLLNVVNDVRFGLGLPFSALSGDLFNSDSSSVQTNGQCSVLITVNGIFNNRVDAYRINQSINQAGGTSFPPASPYNGSGPLPDLPPGRGIARNDTNARVGDIVQILGDELGTLSISEVRLAHKIQDAARQLKQNRCCNDRKIVVVAHSQGTAIANGAIQLLDAETRAMINYYGNGPESFVGTGLGLNSAVNYWNIGDFVPIPRNYLNL